MADQNVSVAERPVRRRRSDLKAAIIRRGFTQRDVAIAARLKERRLSDVISGVVDPDETERAVLEDLLGPDIWGSTESR